MSGTGVILQAGGSHLYPGARGTAAGLPPTPGGPCLVEFADGAAAHATLAVEGDHLVLALAPYTTARGTRVPARRWLVEITAGAAGTRFRVVARAG